MATPRSSDLLAPLGLSLVALLSLGPFFLEPLPAEWVAPYRTAAAEWGSKALVLLVMGLAIGLRVRADRREEPWPLRLHLALVLLAALMTAWHWLDVDSASAVVRDWQRKLYLDILNHTAEAPHNFRPLPYGFTRGLEWLTGDWVFSCLAYRWFFTFWFAWAYYRF